MFFCVKDIFAADYQSLIELERIGAKSLTEVLGKLSEITVVQENEKEKEAILCCLQGMTIEDTAKQTGLTTHAVIK